MNADLEQQRQEYLMNMAEIILEIGLGPEEATQLMFAEIASWLMIIADALNNKSSGISRE